MTKAHERGSIIINTACSVDPLTLRKNHAILKTNICSIAYEERKMAATISNGIKQTPGLRVVPVIASYDADGHVRPLYVRIEETAYKVYNPTIVSTNQWLINFKCEIYDCDVIKTIMLSYNINELTWFIRS